LTEKDITPSIRTEASTTATRPKIENIVAVIRFWATKPSIWLLGVPTK
jgi:hypothetical protein